jgi:hypothetical protein
MMPKACSIARELMESIVDEGTPSEAFDLTGRWRVIHHVQKSSRSRYVG